MDWTAKWIWAKGCSEVPNCYVYARRELDISSPCNAEIDVTCASEYKLYLNGRYVGRGPNPCPPSHQYYDTYDVSRFLRPGANVVAALCYNYGVGTHCRPKMPGGLLLQLRFVDNGGRSRTVLQTDEHWKVMRAPEWDPNSNRMFWTIGYQEVYDSRLKPVGWNVVGFDDSTWEQPEVIGDAHVSPWTRLIPREIPHLREYEVLPERIIDCGTVIPAEAKSDVASQLYADELVPNSDRFSYVGELLSNNKESCVVMPGTDAYVVVDFGKEVVGYPIVRVRDGGVATLDIGYSEALDDRGRVNPTRQSILQADRLVTHGGRQEWQTFGRRAFRYL